MTVSQHATAAAFLFAIGSAVGSFLNVVVHRLPAGRNLLHPPSACPSCGHRIAWHDNVPVLAWCWLRGRCRSCSDPISFRYPMVEALCGLLAASVYLGATFRAGFDLLDEPGAIAGLVMRLGLALTAAAAGWVAVETTRPGTSRSAGWLAAAPSLLVVAWCVAGR